MVGESRGGERGGAPARRALAAAALVAGASAIVVAWTAVRSTPLYLAGLALVVAGLLILAMRRRVLRVVVPLAALALGAAIPWGVVSAAYSTPGAAVAAGAADRAPELFPLSEGRYGVARADAVAAVDGDASELWTWEGDVSRRPYFVGLPGERLLVIERGAGDADSTVLDARTGDVLSTRQHGDPDVRFVAADETGVVTASCPADAEGDDAASAPCTFERFGDGEAEPTWRIRAAEAPAFQAVPDSLSDFSRWREAATAFATADAEGRVEVRAAASGTPVLTTGAAERVTVVEPDRVVVFSGGPDDGAAGSDGGTGPDGAGCAVQVIGVDPSGESWNLSRAAECDVLPGADTVQLASGPALAWQVERIGAGSGEPDQAVLDLDDGTTRVHEGDLDWWDGERAVIGSGVVVQTADGRAAVSDARTGEDLWSARVADGSSVHAKQGLVWTSRTAPHLPMQELFGRTSAGIEIRVFEASTGEAVATARIRGGWSVADGGMLVRAAGADEWRLLGFGGQ